MPRKARVRTHNSQVAHCIHNSASEQKAAQMKISLFLLTVLLGMGAASPVSDTRIVGGDDAKLGQFPYQVSLRSGNRHFCGGSILSENWVVTAAHCTDGAKAVNIVVFTGTINISEGEKYAVDRIVQHEKYDQDRISSDISLLRTKDKILFNELVQPIPIQMSKVNSRQAAVASGWGLTSYPGSVPDTLQFITVKTLTNEECKRKHLIGTAHLIYDGSICTLTKANEGMCMGDSGGPLAVNGELAGIVSWGIPCGVGYPDVFTRVSTFSGWLKDNMADNK